MQAKLHALLLAALISIQPGAALAQASKPAIPETPAGRAFTGWLDAFNQGDKGELTSFLKVHVPWLNAAQQMEQRASTGGYELTSIDGSGPLWIVFHANEKASGKPIFGRVVVRSKDPEHITLLELVSAETHSGEIVLDESERSRVIDGAVKLIEQFYVFPEVAKTTTAKLEALQKRGEYRSITDGRVFAVRLEDDLRVLSGDTHYAVKYFVKEHPEEPNFHHPLDPRLFAVSNCGFENADHLPPNIGYLKVNYLAELEFCAPTAIAAMNFVADSDALIIDLRENHGGAPQMSALISSYLFDEHTHLDDIYDRANNTTGQTWTSLYVPGKKFLGKPVYVLISNQTYSAGEELGFDLKNLRRVTLVGETTGGGAHTISPHRIDNHFHILVPFGRMMDPKTHSDWERTGVEPDIKVPAADALDEALKRARGG